MEKLAQKIHEIIKDYRQEDSIQISPADILEWAYQFGEDAEFMLNELTHLLPQIYFSKDRVQKEMQNMLNKLYKYLNYKSVESFFEDLDFLCLQPSGKSQHILLQMINDIAIKKTSRSIDEYRRYPKKTFVYVDDVLASGGTIGRDLIQWLNEDNHINDIANKKILLCKKKVSIINLLENLFFYIKEKANETGYDCNFRLRKYRKHSACSSDS